MNTRQAAILGSGLLTPDKLPGLAAWYSADYGVLSQVGGGTAFASASSQYLSVADNAGLRTGDVDFTVSGWVKGTAGAGVYFLSKHLGTGDQREWALTTDASNNIVFQVFPTGAAASLVSVSSGVALSANWAYVVAWHNSSANTINIQVNGGTVQSASHATGVFGGSAPFNTCVVGALNTTYLNGSLDEVTFHKRVLTADERTWFYNSGAGRTYAEADDSIKTNLVSWWSMNAPASGNWLDQHGTNHLTPSASRPTATEGVTFNAATDGQTVRRWLDRSGNGRHLDQATLANQPTFTNATTGLTFSGSSSFLATLQNIAPPSGSFTLFASIKTPSGYTAYPSLFSHGYTGSSSGLVVYPRVITTTIDWLSTELVAFGSGSSASQYPRIISQGVGLSSDVILRASLGLESFVEINGSRLTPRITQNSGTFSFVDSKFFVGKSEGFTDYLAGSIRELIVVHNQPPSYLQVIGVTRYLSRKWGVAL